MNEDYGRENRGDLNEEDKLSVNLDPVTSEQPQEKSTWTLPGGVLAMSAAIVMASD